MSKRLFVRKPSAAVSAFWRSRRMIHFIMPFNFASCVEFSIAYFALHFVSKINDRFKFRFAFRLQGRCPDRIEDQFRLMQINGSLTRLTVLDNRRFAGEYLRCGELKQRVSLLSKIIRCQANICRGQNPTTYLVSLPTKEFSKNLSISPQSRIQIKNDVIL